MVTILAPKHLLAPGVLGEDPGRSRSRVEGPDEGGGRGGRGGGLPLLGGEAGDLGLVVQTLLPWEQRVRES